MRLTELGSNDVSASYILHLYRDLTWDLAIHGHSISNINLMRCGPLPRKVTHDCAELFFTAILALKLCPGITGLNPICRIISQNGPAVFHDNENKRLAVEDRFAKTVNKRTKNHFFNSHDPTGTKVENRGASFSSPNRAALSNITLSLLPKAENYFRNPKTMKIV